MGGKFYHFGPLEPVAEEAAKMAKQMLIAGNMALKSRLEEEVHFKGRFQTNLI